MSHTQQGIAAAVVINDGKVLLVRRRVVEGALRWQFPAGEIETSESAETAAVRETQEEVGLLVRPVKTLGERDHPMTGRRMHYVECVVVDGTARLVDADELDALAWCGQSALSEYIPEGVFEAVQNRLAAVLHD
ncbi:NUDIX hydrolase [Kribbella sp. NPDC055110]